MKCRKEILIAALLVIVTALIAGTVKSTDNIGKPVCTKYDIFRATVLENPIFSDAVLEKAIAEQFGGSPADITPERLENITTLTINHAGLKDLTGLEYCTNLEYLDINYNEVEDLTPLRDLPRLKCLSVVRNRICDIFPLSRVIASPGCCCGII